jgi:hypothetical protein
LGVRANKSTVSNYCFVLPHTIVVTGDNAGTNIDRISYVTVTNISKVVNLSVSANLRLFDLNKIANVHIRRQLSTRAKAGEWPNPRASAHIGVIDYTVGMDDHIIPQSRIAHPAIRANRDPVAQFNTPL